MIRNFPRYNAKILLFGEYTLMMGSKALTVPFPAFGGRLAFGKENTAEQQVSNLHLKKFHEFLERCEAEFPLGLELNLREFSEDIENGLYLASDVPQGYGAGSSGVLVAAVYEAYAKSSVVKEKSMDLKLLKAYFSILESYFHGKSSGLDPLACFMGEPLLLCSREKIETVDFKAGLLSPNFGIFLMDTETISKTGDFMKIFLNKANSVKYKDFLTQQLIPRNNSCIDEILGGEIPGFLEDIHELSALQLDFFTEMIPGNFKNLWAEGIRTRDYSLKLCGSGGGGYLLGFSSDLRNAEVFFKEKGKKLIPVFENR
jgi:mevalonate kinase